MDSKKLISECDLSIRSKRLIVTALNLDRPPAVEDLQKLAGVNLVKFRGFGRTTVDEVRQFMNDNNINAF